MTALDLTGLTLGPTAAGVRKQVSRKQWRQIVTAAHKQGFAVDSFLDPSIPGPLKQRTPKYLSQQATSMVKSAYAPAYKELSQREASVKAISDKRAADNQYYNNWLNSQHQALDTAARASDQALVATAQSVQATTGAAYDQAKQGAIQQLSQLPGTVSDFKGANALGAIDAAKGTAVGQVGATGQQALASVGTAEGMRQLASANDFATIAALESKRVGDQWGAMNDLGSERLKLGASESGDISKAVQDALNQEVTKAQSNRDFGAVMQKLDLQGQSQQITAAKNRSAARGKKDTLNETIRYHNQLVNAKTEAQSNSAADFAAKWGVNRDTFLSWTDAQKQQYLKRARDRGVISGGGAGSTTKGSFTPTQLRSGQKTYRSALGWAKAHKPTYGELNSLVTALQAPKTEGQTVHDPATGKIVYNKDGTEKKTGGGGLGIDDPLLAKVVAEVSIYGGVDAKTRKQFKDQYGLTVPLSKKRVSFKPKPGAPTLIDKAK